MKNHLLLGVPGGASSNEPACQCGRHKDVGSIPGSGRSSGGGHGNQVQYSCLKNPMDRGVRILEWVAIPFSRGSSQARDQTQVSWIAGRLFTVWATREVLVKKYLIFSSHEGTILCALESSSAKTPRTCQSFLHHHIGAPWSCLSAEAPGQL